ncbi:uncharacterized protein LOC116162351 [Photinus pyralis]|nr:uncharacterized protein LOC116162351 [Photinus pyralis]
MIDNRLLWYLEKHQLLDETQSGFRPNRSTIDNLVILQTEISQAFGNKNVVIAVSLDIRSAFDVGWRSAILEKLKEFGLSGPLYSFIQHFLNDRSFKVIALEQNEGLGDIKQIIVSGKWPTPIEQKPVNINILFQGKPDLSSKVNILWNSLSEDAKNSLNVNIGSLPTDQQERILLYLYQLAQDKVGKVGIKIDLSPTTIKTAIDKDNSGQLVDIKQIIVSGKWPEQKPVNVNILFQGKPDLASKVNILWNSLSEPSKNLLNINIGSKSPEQQERILLYLYKLAHDKVGKPGVKIDLSPTTIKTVIDKDNKGQLNDMKQIIIIGKWPVPGQEKPVNINILFQGKPDLASKVNILWNSLSDKAKNTINVSLGDMPIDHQERVLLYLYKLAQDKVGKPGIKIDLNPATIKTALDKDINDELEDIQQIIINGRWPQPGEENTVKIDLLFPDKPDLQSKVNLLWNKLTDQGKDNVNKLLGDLTPDQQRPILLYIYDIAKENLKKPNTQLNLDTNTITTVINMEKNNKLEDIKKIIIDGKWPGSENENKVVNVNVLFPDKPELQSKVNVLWNSLTDNAKDTINQNIGDMEPDQQARILLYLLKTIEDKVGQPGVKVNVSPDTIQKIIIKDENDELGDIKNVIITGKWPQPEKEYTVKVNTLFPDKPDLQSKVDLLWDKLTDEGKDNVDDRLKDLTPDQQRPILLYIYNIAKENLDKPNTKLDLDTDTIDKVITLEKNNNLEDIKKIIANGKWPKQGEDKVKINLLFPDKPELKSKVQLLWDSLTDNAKHTIDSNVGSLRPEQQERILLFLLSQLEDQVGKPGVKIDVDQDTIHRIVLKELNDDLENIKEVIDNGKWPTTPKTPEENIVKIHDMFPDKPDLQSKIDLLWDKLTDNGKDNINKLLKDLSPDKQAPVLLYLYDIAKDTLNKPKTKLDLDSDTITTVIKLQEKDKLGDIPQIITLGRWPSESERPIQGLTTTPKTEIHKIKIDELFPDKPDLEEKVKLLWDSLTEDAKDAIDKEIGDKKPEDQAPILLYLFRLLEDKVGQPNVQIDVKPDTIHKIVLKDEAGDLDDIRTIILTGKWPSSESTTTPKTVIHKIHIDDIFPDKPDLEEKVKLLWDSLTEDAKDVIDKEIGDKTPEEQAPILLYLFKLLEDKVGQPNVQIDVKPDTIHKIVLKDETGELDDIKTIILTGKWPSSESTTTPKTQIHKIHIDDIFPDKPDLEEKVKLLWDSLTEDAKDVIDKEIGDKTPEEQAPILLYLFKLLEDKVGQPNVQVDVKPDTIHKIVLKEETGDLDDIKTIIDTGKWPKEEGTTTTTAKTVDTHKVRIDDIFPDKPDLEEKIKILWDSLTEEGKDAIDEVIGDKKPEEQAPILLYLFKLLEDKVGQPNVKVTVEPDTIEKIVLKEERGDLDDIKTIILTGEWPTSGTVTTTTTPKTEEPENDRVNIHEIFPDKPDLQSKIDLLWEKLTPEGKENINDLLEDLPKDKKAPILLYIYDIAKDTLNKPKTKLDLDKDTITTVILREEKDKLGDIPQIIEIGRWPDESERPLKGTTTTTPKTVDVHKVKIDELFPDKPDLEEKVKLLWDSLTEDAKDVIDEELGDKKPEEQAPILLYLFKLLEDKLGQPNVQVNVEPDTIHKIVLKEETGDLDDIKTIIDTGKWPKEEGTTTTTAKTVDTHKVRIDDIFPDKPDLEEKIKVLWDSLTEEGKDAIDEVIGDKKPEEQAPILLYLFKLLEDKVGQPNVKVTVEPDTIEKIVLKEERGDLDDIKTIILTGEWPTSGTVTTTTTPKTEEPENDRVNIHDIFPDKPDLQSKIDLLWDKLTPEGKENINDLLEDLPKDKKAPILLYIYDIAKDTLNKPKTKLDLDKDTITTVILREEKDKLGDIPQIIDLGRWPEESERPLKGTTTTTPKTVDVHKVKIDELFPDKPDLEEKVKLLWDSLTEDAKDVIDEELGDKKPEEQAPVLLYLFKLLEDKLGQPNVQVTVEPDTIHKIVLKEETGDLDDIKTIIDTGKWPKEEGTTTTTAKTVDTHKVRIDDIFPDKPDLEEKIKVLWDSLTEEGKDAIDEVIGDKKPEEQAPILLYLFKLLEDKVGQPNVKVTVEPDTIEKIVLKEERGDLDDIKTIILTGEWPTSGTVTTTTTPKTEEPENDRVNIHDIFPDKPDLQSKIDLLWDKLTPEGKENINDLLEDLPKDKKAPILLYIYDIAKDTLNKPKTKLDLDKDTITTVILREEKDKLGDIPQIIDLGRWPEESERPLKGTTTTTPKTVDVHKVKIDELFPDKPDLEEKIKLLWDSLTEEGKDAIDEVIGDKKPEEQAPILLYLFKLLEDKVGQPNVKVTVEPDTVEKIVLKEERGDLDDIKTIILTGEWPTSGTVTTTTTPKTEEPENDRVNIHEIFPDKPDLQSKIDLLWEKLTPEGKENINDLLEDLPKDKKAPILLYIYDIAKDTLNKPKTKLDLDKDTITTVILREEKDKLGDIPQIIDLGRWPEESERPLKGTTTTTPKTVDVHKVKIDELFPDKPDLEEKVKLLWDSLTEDAKDVIDEELGDKKPEEQAPILLYLFKLLEDKLGQPNVQVTVEPDTIHKIVLKEETGDLDDIKTIIDTGKWPKEEGTTTTTAKTVDTHKVRIDEIFPDKPELEEKIKLLWDSLTEEGKDAIDEVIGDKKPEEQAPILLYLFKLLEDKVGQPNVKVTVEPDTIEKIVLKEERGDLDDIKTIILTGEWPTSGTVTTTTTPKTEEPENDRVNIHEIFPDKPDLQSKIDLLWEKLTPEGKENINDLLEDLPKDKKAPILLYIYDIAKDTLNKPKTKLDLDKDTITTVILREEKDKLGDIPQIIDLGRWPEESERPLKGTTTTTPKTVDVHKVKIDELFPDKPDLEEKVKLLWDSLTEDAKDVIDEELGDKKPEEQAPILLYLFKLLEDKLGQPNVQVNVEPDTIHKIVLKEETGELDDIKTIIDQGKWPRQEGTTTTTPKPVDTHKVRIDDIFPDKPDLEEKIKLLWDSLTEEGKDAIDEVIGDKKPEEQAPILLYLFKLLEDKVGQPNVKVTVEPDTIEKIVLKEERGDLDDIKTIILTGEWPTSGTVTTTTTPKTEEPENDRVNIHEIFPDKPDLQSKIDLLWEKLTPEGKENINDLLEDLPKDKKAPILLYIYDIAKDTLDKPKTKLDLDKDTITTVILREEKDKLGDIPQIIDLGRWPSESERPIKGTTTTTPKTVDTHLVRIDDIFPDKPDLEEKIKLLWDSLTEEGKDAIDKVIGDKKPEEQAPILLYLFKLLEDKLGQPDVKVTVEPDTIEKIVLKDERGDLDDIKTIILTGEWPTSGTVTTTTTPKPEEPENDRVNIHEIFPDKPDLQSKIDLLWDKLTPEGKENINDLLEDLPKDKKAPILLYIYDIAKDTLNKPNTKLDLDKDTITKVILREEKDKLGDIPQIIDLGRWPSESERPVKGTTTPKTEEPENTRVPIHDLFPDKPDLQSKIDLMWSKLTPEGKENVNDLLEDLPKDKQAPILLYIYDIAKDTVDKPNTKLALDRDTITTVILREEKDKLGDIPQIIDLGRWPSESERPIKGTTTPKTEEPENTRVPIHDLFPDKPDLQSKIDLMWSKLTPEGKENVNDLLEDLPKDKQAPILLYIYDIAKDTLDKPNTKLDLDRDTITTVILREEKDKLGDIPQIIILGRWPSESERPIKGTTTPKPEEPENNRVPIHDLFPDKPDLQSKIDLMWSKLTPEGKKNVNDLLEDLPKDKQAPILLYIYDIAKDTLDKPNTKLDLDRDTITTVILREEKDKLGDIPQIIILGRWPSESERPIKGTTTPKPEEPENNRVPIHDLFPDKPDLQSKIDLMWSKLTPEGKKNVNDLLEDLPKDKQAPILLYIYDIAKDTLDKPNTKLDLDRDTITTVILREEKDKLGDIPQIIILGRWPSESERPIKGTTTPKPEEPENNRVPIHDLFPDKPDLQSKIDLMWSKLTPEGKKNVNDLLEDLPKDKQAPILLYIYDIAKDTLDKPNTKLDLDRDTITTVILREEKDKLGDIPQIIILGRWPSESERPIKGTTTPKPEEPENNRVPIHDLFPDKPDLQSKIDLMWSKLTPEGKKNVNDLLEDLPKDKQAPILLYIYDIAKDTLDKPNTKLDLDRDTITTVILREEKDKLGDIPQIIILGRWPSESERPIKGTTTPKPEEPENNRVPIHDLFPDKPDLQSKIDLMWSKLTPEGKKNVNDLLEDLPKDKQAPILLYIYDIAKDTLDKPNTKLDLDRDTITTVILREEKDKLGDIPQIIILGRWPSESERPIKGTTTPKPEEPENNRVPIHDLFPDKPDLQSKIDLMWSKLTPDGKDNVNDLLGDLPKDKQAPILLYIYDIAKDTLDKPNTKLSLDRDTINTVILREQKDKLGDIPQIIILGRWPSESERPVKGVTTPKTEEPEPSKIDINQLFPNDPQTQNEIKKYLLTLPKEMQDQVLIYLFKLPPDDRIEIVRYLIKLNEGVKETQNSLDLETLRKIMELQRKDQLEHKEGELPVNVDKIFPDRPDLQAAIRFFLNNLSNRASELIRIHLSDLTPDAQGRILLYLINLSRKILETPGIRVDLDLQALKTVIRMYNMNGLKGVENGTYPTKHTGEAIHHTMPPPPKNIQERVNLQIKALFPGAPEFVPRFIAFLDTMNAGPSTMQYEYDPDVLNLYFEAFLESLTDKEKDKIATGKPVVKEPSIIDYINFHKLIPGDADLQARLRVYLEGLDRESQEIMVFIFSLLDPIPPYSQRQLRMVLTSTNDSQWKMNAIIQWIPTLPASVTKRLEEVGGIKTTEIGGSTGSNVINYEKLLPGNPSLQVTLRKFVEGVEPNAQNTIQILFSHLQPLPKMYQDQLSNILLTTPGALQVPKVMQWASSLPKSLLGNMEIIKQTGTANGGWVAAAPPTVGNGYSTILHAMKNKAHGGFSEMMKSLPVSGLTVVQPKQPRRALREVDASKMKETAEEAKSAISNLMETAKDKVQHYWTLFSNEMASIGQKIAETAKKVPEYFSKADYGKKE